MEGKVRRGKEVDRGRVERCEVKWIDSGEMKLWEGVWVDIGVCEENRGREDGFVVVVSGMGMVLDFGRDEGDDRL